MDEQQKCSSCKEIDGDFTIKETGGYFKQCDACREKRREQYRRNNNFGTIFSFNQYRLEIDLF